MIRALGICILAVGLGLPAVLWAQGPQQAQLQTLERQVVEALVQEDAAAVRHHARQLERLIDRGTRKDGWTRTAQYGFLAEVLFRIGDVAETERYYAKAAGAARQDGHWTDRHGLAVRYEWGNTLLLLDRPAEALTVAQALFADLQRAGQLAAQPGMEAAILVGSAQLTLGTVAQAEQTFRQVLAIANRHDPDGRMVQLASGGLALALTRTGQYDEALTHTRRETQLTLATHAPDTMLGLNARVKLGVALENANRLPEARQVVEAVVQTADRVLSPTHEIALWAQEALARITQAQGNTLAARALNRDPAAQMATDTGPLRQLDTLEEHASQLLGAGQFDAYERALRESLLHVNRHPDLPAFRTARILVDLSKFRVDHRGDLHMAHALLSRALRILNRDLGPDHPDTLRAEAEWIYAKQIEIDTEALWRKAHQKPVFWDGTEADKPPSARDLEVFRRLAAHERRNGSGYAAVATAMNYVGQLNRADRYDAAIAVLKAELERQSQARAAGQPRDPEVDFVILQALGSTFMGNARYDAAATVFRNGVDEVLTLLRSRQWLSATGDLGRSLITGQLYGQSYAKAAWKAAQSRPKSQQDVYLGMAFQAMQMAGYGPATAAVARAALRDKAQDPALTAPPPDLIASQVPAPVSLAALQTTLIGPDEAIIAILPANGGRANDGAFNGLILAATRDGAVFAELSSGWDQLVFDILQLHDALDPGGGGTVRAPLANLQGAAPTRRTPAFAFGAARRLYETFFGQPEIAALIGPKHSWTLVPLGATLSVPFSALVIEDTGNRLTRARTASELRSIRWLGHERALTVVPSVAALADLRGRGDRLSAQPLSYVGFGDPAFGGQSADSLPTTDAVMRGPPPDRAAALRRLPRLPGTRREVETLAGVFDAGSSLTFLGRNATEAQLRKLNETGALRNVRVLHFATHGLLTGAFQGLAEPALALTPQSGAADGLLTASEAARLRIGADWVILSACDTAGEDSLAGDGLGGLVQGFFAAGARNLLVSHWRVDDRAAEHLITQSVAAAQSDGTSKAEALRRAMISLAADPSRDDTGLPNAHPSIWAPFLVVGGG